jgi:hypothetical protein
MGNDVVARFLGTGEIIDQRRSPGSIPLVTTICVGEGRAGLSFERGKAATRSDAQSAERLHFRSFRRLEPERCGRLDRRTAGAPASDSSD